MKQTLPLILAVAATSALAEDSRQLDAHEHGVGALNIAVDGTTVAMEFTAPGADIVGFEYEATSDEDLAKIDAAIETLTSPLALFAFNAEAGCTVTAATAELETEDDHDDHDHGEEHAEDDHDHDHGDDHAEDKDEHDHDHGADHAKDDDHDHDHEEEHAEAEHDHDDAHDHDKDDDQEHGEDHALEDHDDHAEEASHTEFHAEYALTCDAPDAIADITFAYFETFPNALELEVQVLTSAGAQAFEVERDEPTLSLAGLF